VSAVAGIALATGAACCFNGSVALQALEVRRLPVGPATGLAPLLRRPRWLAATALSIAGWPLHIAALAVAPLTIVQPALATGLILLLVLGAHVLHEPVRARDLAAVAAIAIGLGLLAWAAPQQGPVDARPAAVALAVLGVIAGLPWLTRGHLPALALVGAAGGGYAASGITTKLVADAGFTLAGLGWAAGTGLVAGLALMDEMAALQRAGAARVAAGAFAVQTIVPVALAPVVADEHWDQPLAIVVGLILVAAGSLGLGTARAVTGLVSAAH
jgi:hypothetical protein